MKGLLRGKFIDINTKNKKVSLKGKTKYGLPDWKIKSNVFWSDVINHGKVKK